MRARIVAALAGSAVMASPAAGQSTEIVLPPGSLAQAVSILSAQTRTSIAVPDPELWHRRVPGLRGRMSAAEAVRRLARSARATARPAGPDAWRLIPLTAPRPRQPATPSTSNAAVPEPPIDDIVVVASKRDAGLLGYPATVSMVDGRTLAEGGETGTDALLARLATLSSTHLGAGRNKLFIRGVADSSFTGPTQATVGQYLGDVRLTYNAPDPDLRLYDVARVEVLEGPQGTLYGAGSLGGIVRVVRNDPALDRTEGALAAGASATWHGEPGADLGGVLNLPIATDRAALRLVGYGLTEGGYIDDPLRDKRDINRSRVAGGRAQLRLAPIDRWTVDLGITGQGTWGDDSQYADRDAPRLTRQSRIAQGYQGDYLLGELIVRGQLGDLDLVSSSGVVRQRLTERYDASQPDEAPQLFRQRNSTDFWSTENRLSRPMANGWSWVAGFSLLHNRTLLSRALGSPGASVPATGVANRITEGTIFGEMGVEVLRDLTVTAGGRVSHARLSGAGEDVAPLIALARASVTAGRTETSVLPSLAVSATPLRHLTLYARYQQGFRPGGLAIEGPFVRRFLSDRVRTLEAGLRQGVPGRSPVDLSVSVSRTDWQDIQADFLDAGGLPSTANIGDGRINSLAAAIGVAPVPGLRLEAGLALNDSRVTDPSAALVAAFALGRIAQIPNIAGTVARGAVSYQATLPGGQRISLDASARYTGKSRLGVGPVLGAEQGNYLDTRMSARLGLRHWGVTLSVTNIADAVGNRFALGTPFVSGSAGQITPLRPRTVRIGIDTSF
ncbi:TonB-dependent receptor [Sphingomonas aerophila]|uniref:Outer membrane receptor protein involved in Fe transport n=1 Tax=Sphingomonas aerophila TaxID=1344948 RepID=A0A7W9BE60_9SPHN|nr:outer membrane receptor protein involved in Fe transport [Sphingomonas aerophila]